MHKFMILIWIFFEHYERGWCCVVTERVLHTLSVVGLNFFSSPGMSRQDDDTRDRNRRMSGREISKLCATIFLLSLTWNRNFPLYLPASLWHRLQGISFRRSEQLEWEATRNFMTQDFIKIFISSPSCCL